MNQKKYIKFNNKNDKVLKKNVEQENTKKELLKKKKEMKNLSIRSKTGKNINLKEKIINTLMKNGKKEKSEILFFKTIKKLQKTTLKDHVDLIKIGILNSMNKILKRETKKKKRRAATYFSYVLKEENRIKHAVKNSLKGLEKKKSVYKTLYLKLIENSKEENIVSKNIVD